MRLWGAAVLGGLWFLGFFGCSSSSDDLGTTAECKKDTDCKGTRICVDGACTEPDDDASVSPPAGTGGRATGGSGGRNANGGTGGATIPPADTGGVFGTGGRTTSTGGKIGAGGLGTGGTPDSPDGGRCQTFPTKTTTVPVDAYVMFDQSTSMMDAVPPPGTGTWWDAASQGVSTFAHDASAAGASVGLQYFPLGGVAPASCSASYGTPEVEVALLPGNASALDASLAKHVPNGLTPSGPALAGAIAHMKAWAGNHPNHLAAVVFVTDGYPTECTPTDPADLAAIAKTGLESEPPVLTTVVGLNLGLGKEVLNQIAKAGGTTAAIFINGGDISAQIANALRAGTQEPTSCVLDLPAAGQADPPHVSLTHAPPSGFEEDIPRLNTAGDCVLNQNDGFYFDNAQAPKKVILCPGSCGQVTSGKLTIGVGCRQTFTP